MEKRFGNYLLEKSHFSYMKQCFRNYFRNNFRVECSKVFLVGPYLGAGWRNGISPIEHQFVIRKVSFAPLGLHKAWTSPGKPAEETHGNHSAENVPSGPHRVGDS